MTRRDWSLEQRRIAPYLGNPYIRVATDGHAADGGRTLSRAEPYRMLGGGMNMPLAA